MISEPVTLLAPAKVNLTLHVTGRRSDGYHLLDSLVFFADLADRIEVRPADTLSLDVTGPFAEGVPADQRNLVWQAAALGPQPLALRLEKNLPHGAGIGGGSSDAAALLKHLELDGAAAGLGADVPVCLAARAQRMQGIGEILTPLAGAPPLQALLVNPGIPVPTPAVFGALAEKENPAMPERLPTWKTAKALVNFLATMRNDLQAPALQIAPEIGQVLEAIEAQGGFARMSGSGSTCFGLFEAGSDAERAARALQRAQPGWWVRACRLS